MKTELRVLAAFAAAALGAFCSGGCSGPGAGVVPRDVQELQGAADDHLSALLLVKRWFTIMHPRDMAAAADTGAAQSCPISVDENVPAEPGDPPGSSRTHIVLSDCSTVEYLEFADGSGERVFRYPDGREKLMTWTATQANGELRWRDAVETYWDGATLAYRSGWDRASTVFAAYKRGVATLPDDRTMDFEWERDLTADALGLTASSGEQLRVDMSLHSLPDRHYAPLYADGAAGTYRNAEGGRQEFALGSSTGAAWDQWTLLCAAGTQGSFTLAPDFSGSGRLTRAGDLLGALGWLPTGMGTLDPVMATAIDAVPSDAARDFLVDSWIGHNASLAPKPRY